MKIYKIKEDELRAVLKKELRNAYDFEWTGWRIPIYYNEETGRVSSGSWLSNNSHQPDILELTSIESWSIDDVDNPNNEDIECFIDGVIDELIENEHINHNCDYLGYKFELI